jgi:ATP-dependent RNA helicase DeaD
MLDLGLMVDVERILRMCPSGRQTALFSATMPPPIKKLAESYMYDPTTIRITPKTLTVDAIAQAYVEVPAKEKPARLVELLKAEEPEQAIIFCRTKIGASRLEKTLKDKGLDVKALHGDMSQGSRDGVMIAFKDHRVRLLVATDIAARGLDIEHVTHVINYDVPASSEVYVHRIGRTGRVGRTGRAITFVTPAQHDEIARIERDVKTTIGQWETPEERLEHAPRPRRREKAEEAPSTNGAPVKLFVNHGERSGISEKDLRWALREGAVLPDDAIHDVHVLHRFSFVHVDPEVAERTVEYLSGTKLNGREIRLEIARN